MQHANRSSLDPEVFNNSITNRGLNNALNLNFVVPFGISLIETNTYFQLFILAYTYVNLIMLIPTLVFSYHMVDR